MIKKITMSELRAKSILLFQQIFHAKNDNFLRTNFKPLRLEHDEIATRFLFLRRKKRKRNQRKNNSKGNRNKPINVKRDETNQLKN